MTKFYQEKFTKKSITTKSPLENPSTVSIKANITNKKVIDAINKPKNNRSSGYDILIAEVMKRLNIITIKQLTDILKDTIDNKCNAVFIKRFSL